VPGDHAVVAADHLGHAGAVGCDHPAHVLRLRPRRKRGRADQIAEHHRQQASLGVVGRYRLARRCGRRQRGRVERGDGARYKVVHVEAEPGLPDHLIHCTACRKPLPGTDGENNILKYFLVGRARV
jgi:hypothetical protein